MGTFLISLLSWDTTNPGTYIYAPDNLLSHCLECAFSFTSHIWPWKHHCCPLWGMSLFSLCLNDNTLPPTTFKSEKFVDHGSCAHLGKCQLSAGARQNEYCSLRANIHSIPNQHHMRFVRQHLAPMLNDKRGTPTSVVFTNYHVVSLSSLFPQTSRHCSSHMGSALNRGL